MFLISRLHSNLITWNLITLFIRLFPLHSNIYKKQVFDFLKRCSYTNVCLKFLCDVLITQLLIFRFLVKICHENRISILMHSGITSFWIWLFSGAKYQGRGKAGARGTNEQPLSDKPLLIRCGETHSTWQ